jgi:hypothetical protein
MHYELWHGETANLMDDFADEAEALDAVRAYLTPDEDGVTVDVALLVFDEAGQPRSVEGRALASWAYGSDQGKVRRSA